MAILGGAVIAALQGIASDRTGSINHSYAVPLCCFVVVVAYSLYIERKSLKKIQVSIKNLKE
jgi:FHS family L-fucose permease-like MFS transporter